MRQQAVLWPFIRQFLIERALEGAAKAIRSDNSIRVEPVIDRDTVGVPGAPDIASTIFGKIEQAHVFVCDISIINQGMVARPTPNPNVLLELGYAMKALGTQRAIMVLNAAFGEPELLPFDLRMRRVLRYHMPAASEDRATERKRLEGMLAEGLRAIFAGLDAPPPGEIIRPVPIGEQARAAVEEGHPSQVALARRYMAWLAGEIGALAPKYAGVEQGRWDEMLLEAIEASRGPVVEFARLAEASAIMDAAETARAVYKGFADILELYQPARGFSGEFRTIDFDFAKFVGHELFVTFFSALIREGRWELIADLFEEDLYVVNTPEGRPGVVPFDYVSQHLELLEHRKRRLNSNRMSLHADLLNERHTQGDLARLVPMAQFVEADYFLFLRGQLPPAEDPHWPEWGAWSTLYMRDAPRYLVDASRVKYAQRLLRPLGVEDVQTLRDRFAECAPRLRKLFNTGLWRDPLWGFDPQSIGSR